MADSRFPELDPKTYSPDQARLAAELTRGPRGSVRGPYVPLIYSPELADRMRHLGDFVRFEGVLPPRLKEIVILLAARHWSVDYMFAVHREMSAAAGLDAAMVEAIARGRRPEGLGAAEAAAYDMAGQLLRNGRVGDAAFAAVRDALGERGAVELTAFVGYYTLLAMILNMARIAAPADAAPLPAPDS